MTRPTASDRACLDAQLQAQVAQRLTAELAVSCPDCGVEAGRACCDSFDRAVKTHLARQVASSKRDTEPCPAPSEGAFKRDLHAMIEAGLEQESLTRAAARAFAESLLAPTVEVSKEELRELYPEPERPVCDCGQTIWDETCRFCGDCLSMNVHFGAEPDRTPLDKRIAEAKSDDATECAWSTPTSDGEGWR